MQRAPELKAWQLQGQVRKKKIKAFHKSHFALSTRPCNALQMQCLKQIKIFSSVDVQQKCKFQFLPRSNKFIAFRQFHPMVNSLWWAKIKGKTLKWFQIWIFVEFWSWPVDFRHPVFLAILVPVSCASLVVLFLHSATSVLWSFHCKWSLAIILCSLKLHSYYNTWNLQRSVACSFLESFNATIMLQVTVTKKIHHELAS